MKYLIIHFSHGYIHIHTIKICDDGAVVSVFVSRLALSKTMCRENRYPEQCLRSRTYGVLASKLRVFKHDVAIF